MASIRHDGSLRWLGIPPGGCRAGDAEERFRLAVDTVVDGFLARPA